MYMYFILISLEGLLREHFLINIWITDIPVLIIASYSGIWNDDTVH